MPRTRLQLAGALGHAAADKRLEILRQVGEAGSISEAARAAGVSYKAAWQALDTLSNLAGAPLVTRSVGGAGGGGARLTPAGEQLLRAAGEMGQARAQVLARLTAGAAAVPALAGLALRTSMRNQLPARVVRIEQAGPLAQIHLALGPDAAGGALVARITSESAELLGLVPGQGVLALCKATAVRVLPAAAARAGAINQLAAQARRVARGALGDEVAAQLAGGPQMVGFAAAGSGLRAGRRVVLQVDESAVVVALA